MDNPPPPADFPPGPEPAEVPPTGPIPVDLAMLYTLWGRAVLLRDPATASELESLILSAAAAAPDTGTLDAALASIGARDIPFERSTLDLAIARLVMANQRRSEFRLFSLRATEIAGYLLHQQRLEYIGAPWRHQVRHDRVTELLPPRTAMSAFHAVARGHRSDHAFRTEFDTPSQLSVQLGSACTRFKLYDAPPFQPARLYLYRDASDPSPLNPPVHVRLAKPPAQARLPAREHRLECVNDADLLLLHAALHQAEWIHLQTTNFCLLARMPSLDEQGSTSLARYSAHRVLRTYTGIPSDIHLPIPRELAERLTAAHRWFAPTRTRDWRWLLANHEAQVDAGICESEPDGWLIS